MEVTILRIEQCHNADLLTARLEELLSGRGISLRTVVVSDEQDAVRQGFHGSPTLLIDGKDPFPAPDSPVGLSCRYYPNGSNGSERTTTIPTSTELATLLGIVDSI